ncbi:MAG: cobalamin biosynthesis protein, partial [Candidatus Omnitrophica bacterium]|nr:cobalamin biosynthesis protein [Candidatus Omnitrophota bacterium]
EGAKLAKRLKADFPNANLFNGPMSRNGGLKKLAGNVFNKYEGLIFIAALGVTVRLISAHIKNKFRDPAVVSVDTAGRFSVSVLSGHEGGANRLAFLVAASLDAMPVITTGKEVHKKFVLGVGTRRGISADNVKSAIKKAIKKKGIDLEAVRLVSTADLKKNEKGLIKACRDLGLPLVFIPREGIQNFKGGVSVSEAARRHCGLDGVCEPCALLAGRRAGLTLKKQIWNGVTVAVAEEN